MKKSSIIFNGITDLDRIIKEFRRSGLILLGARPSDSKMLFALLLADRIVVKDKKSVGFFSFKMTTKSVISRLNFCKRKTNSLYTKKKEYVNEGLYEYNELIKNIKKVPLYIEGIPNISLDYFLFRVKQLKEEKNVEIIFIDSYSFLKMDHKLQDKCTNKIESLLKTLSGEFNILIVMLVHLEMMKYGKIFSVEDIKDAESLIPLADIII